MNRRRLLKALSGLPLLGAFAALRPAAEAAPAERSRLMVGVDTGGPDTTVAWIGHPDGRLVAVPELQAGIIEGDLVELSVPSHPNCRCALAPVRPESPFPCVAEKVDLSPEQIEEITGQVKLFSSGMRRVIGTVEKASEETGRVTAMLNPDWRGIE